MKQKFTLLLTAFLLLAGMSLRGQSRTEASIDFSAQGYENAQDMDGVVIDIDDKSVQNARENAAFNNVEIDVRLGSSIEGLGTFNLILANIHRNVLLAQMPLYAIGLLPDGQLWLSGFYEADCSPLMEAATKQGLQLIATHQNGEWRMLQFRKK